LRALALLSLQACLIFARFAPYAGTYTQDNTKSVARIAYSRTLVLSELQVITSLLLPKGCISYPGHMRKAARRM